MKTTLLVLAAAVLLFATACGGAKVTTTTNAQGQRVVACAGTVHFARAKVVLHAGLAFGAFHRYILKPYRAGSFAKGAPGRTKALAKAAASAVFAYHELKVARADAICDGPTLRRLATSMTTALGAINSLRALKTGAALGLVESVAKRFDVLKSQAETGGVSIQDR